MTKASRAFTSSLLLSSLLLAAGAQASTIRGRVTDPLGAAVANAQVQLLDNNRAVATTGTDSTGNFVLRDVKAGRFRLRAAAATFSATDSESFFVTDKETAVRNIVLPLPEIRQEVVVTATGVPISQAQVGASVAVLQGQDYLNRLDVLDPLRSAPGVQLTQTGQRGAAATLFIRGGNSDSSKVLIDGVPATEVGGLTNFGVLSAAGVDQIEVFRGPNSVLYGADALAGVVNQATRRGTTLAPELTFSADGGNFGTYGQQGTVGGAWRELDYFSSYSFFNTSNTIPNSRFRNGTYAGNFGWSIDNANSLRVTVRRLGTSLGAPNSIELFGVPDTGHQNDHDTFIGATYENQATTKWHNLLRYGASRLDRKFNKPFSPGIPSNGVFLGTPVTLHGGNGFTVTGQAILDFDGCCPQSNVSVAKRDFVYGQTDYSFSPHLTSLLAYRYEAERGTSSSVSPFGSFGNSVDRRNMSYILETHGDLWNRLFFSLGGALEKNAVFGTEATPRVTLAFYPFLSSSGVWRATKLKASFGKGIKEPSIFEETSSLFDVLRSTPGGQQRIEQDGIRPIGAVRSRSYELGIEQSITDSTRINLTVFHNQFKDVIEFVSNNGLTHLGLAPINAFGATINSSDFRAQGLEAEIIHRVSKSLIARAGYTLLDAKVQRSFTDDVLFPSFNPLFPTVPIGAFSPLVGARPFRRARNSGFISVTYNRSRWAALLQGSFIGHRDDSTFLLFSDANFDNTLLLPNQNLDKPYQKLDLSGDFRVNRFLRLYASMENLLSQHYDEAFGFPAAPFTFRAGIKLVLGGESWQRK
jgi:iron complex outermembrane receptor protein/vitamin B12 transporter